MKHWIERDGRFVAVEGASEYNWGFEDNNDAVYKSPSTNSSTTINGINPIETMDGINSKKESNEYTSYNSKYYFNSLGDFFKKTRKGDYKPVSRRKNLKLKELKLEFADSDWKNFYIDSNDAPYFNGHTYLDKEKSYTAVGPYRTYYRPGVGIRTSNIFGTRYYRPGSKGYNRLLKRHNWGKHEPIIQLELI